MTRRGEQEGARVGCSPLREIRTALIWFTSRDVPSSRCLPQMNACFRFAALITWSAFFADRRTSPLSSSRL